MVGRVLDEGHFTSEGRLDGRARLQAREDATIGGIALLDMIGQVPLVLQGLG